MRLHSTLRILALLLLPALASTATATAGQCSFGAVDANGLQRGEIAPASFTITNSAVDVGWHVATQGGPDAADDLAGHEDAARLWYSSVDASQANYASGLTEENPTYGTATSPTIDVPAVATSPAFYFSNRYEIESSEAATHDLMLVDLSIDNGLSWTSLCTLNPTIARHGTIDETTCSDGLNAQGTYPCPVDPASAVTLSRWEGRTMSLPTSVIGQHIKIRFTFDSVDGQQNTGLGWMVTDIRVGYALPLNTIEPPAPPTPPVPLAPPPPPPVPSMTPPTVVTTSLPGPGSLTPVPTLSEYSIMALIGALAIMGTVLVRRGEK